MFLGLKFDELYENGIAISSPVARFKLCQSIDEASSLGGVPVFNLPDLNPKESRDSVIPSAAFSPILPARIFFWPTCTNPFKNVPHVSIRVEHPIVWPSLIIAAVTTPLSVTISTISPARTVIYFAFLIVLLMNPSYVLLST